MNQPLVASSIVLDNPRVTLDSRSSSSLTRGYTLSPASRLPEPASSGSRLRGAKHPLLSLAAADIEEAWGDDDRYIWIRRELKDAIVSLKRMNWWQDPERIQSDVYESAQRFIHSRQNDESAFGPAATCEVTFPVTLEMFGYGRAICDRKSTRSAWE